MSKRIGWEHNLTLEVLRWDSLQSLFRCKDEQGQEHWVDLFVSANPCMEEYLEHPENLVGKKY